MNVSLRSATLACIGFLILLIGACPGYCTWQPSPDIDTAGHLRLFPSGEYQRSTDSRVSPPTDLIARAGETVEMKVGGLAGVAVAAEDLDRYSDPFEDCPDECFNCFWKVYDKDNNLIAESTGGTFQYAFATEDVGRGPIRIRWFAQDGGCHTSSSYPGNRDPGLPEGANDEDLCNDYLIAVVGTDIDTDSNNDGTITQSDDLIEENYPGKYIELNIDDDNANEVQDRDDTGAVTGEDDLAEVRLAYSPTTGVDGCRITLVASQGTDRVRVWKSPTKDVGDEIAVSGSGTTYLIGTDTIPSTVYAEGILAGSAALDLVFRLADYTEVCRDKVDHDSGETVYAYYDNGWIHTITDRDQGTTTFEFHPDGMVEKITYPNGTYTEYGFDTSGGLSSLVNKRADGVVLAGFGFYYETTDDNGASWPGQILVTRVVEQVRLPDPNPDNLMAEATIYYAYDDQYRVVRERRVGDLPFDRNYSYDAVGNRSSLVTKDAQGHVSSTIGYTHDEVGRILTKGSVTFDYDFDDLTMTRTEGANVRRYSFSAEGNLIRVEDGQDVVAQFTYDGLGRPTSFTGIDGITRGARFDLDSIIAEESIEGTTHYLFDELGLLYGASDSETRRYYHFNDMGDTCALTTAGPTVGEQWAATYDVFGVISVIDAQSLNALNAARALHSSRILAFSDPDQPFQSGGQGGGLYAAWGGWDEPERCWRERGQPVGWRRPLDMLAAASAAGTVVPAGDVVLVERA